MIVISSNGFGFQIDPEDYDRIKLFIWTGHEYSDKGIQYLSTHIDGKTVYMHRFLMDAPEGLYVDHINRNGLDNRKENLRVVGQRKNLANAGMFKNNTTGLRGVIVYRHRGYRGQTKLRLNGIQYLISTKGYEHPHDAALVRDEIIRRIHGDNSYLNFPGIMPTGELLDECDKIEERMAKRGISFSVIANDLAA